VDALHKTYGFEFSYHLQRLPAKYMRFRAGATLLRRGVELPRCILFWPPFVEALQAWSVTYNNLLMRRGKS
jgi:hypothetical protein